jgi:hypothetical protein
VAGFSCRFLRLPLQFSEQDLFWLLESPVCTGYA